MRVPFDGICLACVVGELRRWAGARVQKVLQSDAWTVRIELYLRGSAWLTLCWHPEAARCTVTAQRPASKQGPSNLASEIRRRLGDGRLLSASQRGLDRVLDLDFSTAEGEYQIVAELMGKHSNVILMDARHRMVAAAKWVGPHRSRRTVLPGHEYAPPPFEPRPSLLAAESTQHLRDFEGWSPFLQRLVEASGPDGLRHVQDAVREEEFAPFASPPHGAYPLSLAPLGLAGKPVESYSAAAEAHFCTLSEGVELEHRRSWLLGQIRRVRLAREVAIADLEQAADAAARASELQRRGEIILAYASQIRPGSSSLEAYDFDGQPITVALRTDLTPLENAQRLFDRARKSKQSAEHVREQLSRLGADLEDLVRSEARISSAASATELEQERSYCDSRRWLTVRSPEPKAKEQRPYEGHAIRELLAPGGWKVLYGENAAANDYLTLRVARPNDWWLHVRGAVSAHVVIQTNNQPQRVAQEAFDYAARVAVRNSPSKHSSYVPVDVTLRKYVRRPKGAAPGLALYSQERTLHVEGAM